MESSPVTLGSDCAVRVPMRIAAFAGARDLNGGRTR